MAAKAKKQAAARGKKLSTKSLNSVKPLKSAGGPVKYVEVKLDAPTISNF
jgi:hypothetical protein